MYTIVPFVHPCGICRPSLIRFASFVMVLLPIVLLLCMIPLVFHHSHVLFCWAVSLFPGLCRVPWIPDSPRFPLHVPLLSLAPGSLVGVFHAGSAIHSSSICPVLFPECVLFVAPGGLYLFWSILASILPIFWVFLAIPGIPPHPASSWLYDLMFCPPLVCSGIPISAACHCGQLIVVIFLARLLVSWFPISIVSE